MFVAHTLYIGGVVALFVASLAVPRWSSTHDLLLPNTTLTYGLFSVCGYESYSYAFNITSDCYEYNSNELPPPLYRTNHLDQVLGCEKCEGRRLATIAMALIATILACVSLVAVIKEANSEFLMLYLPPIAGVFGCIAMSVWVVLIRLYWNHDRRWVELDMGSSGPRMSSDISLHMCAAAWVLAICYPVIAQALPSTTVGSCPSRPKSLSSSRPRPKLSATYRPSSTSRKPKRARTLSIRDAALELEDCDNNGESPTRAYVHRSATTASDDGEVAHVSRHRANTVGDTASLSSADSFVSVDDIPDAIPVTSTVAPEGPSQPNVLLTYATSKQQQEQQQQPPPPPSPQQQQQQQQQRGEDEPPPTYDESVV